MDQTRAECHGSVAECPHLQGAGVHVLALGDETLVGSGAMHDVAYIVFTARDVAYINISILIVIQNPWQDRSWGSCISMPLRAGC